MIKRAEIFWAIRYPIFQFFETFFQVRVIPESEWLRADESKIMDIPGEDVLVAKVSGLRAYTSYHVFVSAYTIVGNGPENTVPSLAETEEDSK